MRYLLLTLLLFTLALFVHTDACASPSNSKDAAPGVADLPQIPLETDVHADTTQYRTALYRDWADAADQKGKRKSIKCKPDKVDFSFVLHVPPPSGSSDPFTRFKLSFNMPIQYLLLFRQAVHTDTLTCAPTTNGSKSKQVFDLSGCLPIPDSILFEGRGSKGKQAKVTYTWYTANSQNTKGLGGILPTKPRPQLDDRFIYNYPRFPMPNLHNVGEGIFGGVMQTPVHINVGSQFPQAPGTAHSVSMSKYSDVLKSLVKVQGAPLYHTATGHCLDKFDGNHKDIKTVQKALPPDKHNNRLFAEQLALRLSLAASDSGLFPQGFGDLIFDNSGDSPGPFDGQTVRAIADSIDRYLSAADRTLGCIGYGDPLYFVSVDSLINAAFAGPMDTVSWSCEKVICTGVRPLSEVPYMHENPQASPHVNFARWSPQMYQQPKEFRLEQNYPNPFNPVTTIQFDLPLPSIVTLKIFNALGQEVATLADNELMEDGTQVLDFDAATLASGLYFYRITAQSVDEDGLGITGQKFVQTMKMLLVK